MPRLKGFRLRLQHDFAWNVWLEPEDTAWLFARPDTLKPPDNVPVLACGVDHYASFGCDLIVLEASLSRSDAVLTMMVNDTQVTFSGPWMESSAISLHNFLSIYMDTCEEVKAGKRKQKDAVAILGEMLAKSKWAGVFRPGIHLRRKPLSADMRLLPGAPAGYVTCHVRVLFTIDVDANP